MLSSLVAFIDAERSMTMMRSRLSSVLNLGWQRAKMTNISAISMMRREIIFLILLKRELEFFSVKIFSHRNHAFVVFLRGRTLRR